MNRTKSYTGVAIELGKEDTEYNEYLLKDSKDDDKLKKKRKAEKRDRCKRFITQTMTMFSRFSSLFDLITDGVLLWRASSNNVINLTLILSLSIVSPYILSYSSGIKLFIYRKTFDNLVGFRNIFLILYLLPSGFLYFVLLDLIDILLSIWIWILHNILCRHEQYLKELQNIIAKDLGMDRMNFEGFKRQKSISQILFETIPQLILQILLELEVIPGKELAGITSIELQISIATAMFNFIIQIAKLYIESVAVNERFVEYCLNAMMGRVKWVPFRLKVVKLARNIAYTQNENMGARAVQKTHKTCCSKWCSVYYHNPEDDENTINYNIKYRLPLISYLSNNEILSTVEYDFSVVTIGHLIATINQLQTTSATQISIKFHKSLKLLGIKEIVKLMEVCKRKNVLLPDIAQCVDWAHSFAISSTIHENDPRLATYCRDYNDRPLLISMYKTKYDKQVYSILRSFLNNDCPQSLKDSNNETIVYHMIRNYDYKALKILFKKQKEKNCEMNNLNFYNKAGYSPLYLALKYDLLQLEHVQDDKEPMDDVIDPLNEKINNVDSENEEEIKTEGDKDGDGPNNAAVEEVSNKEEKEEKKQEGDVNDLHEWHQQMIHICVAQKYEYNTAANAIRCKFNCILMEILANVQRNRKLIHCVYECLYECKAAQHNQTMANVNLFLSKCTNQKIAEFTHKFLSNNDMKSLLSSIQNMLDVDYASIADFGPNGSMAHYFSALVDNYDHDRVQQTIDEVEKSELNKVDEKVKEHMQNYAFINEIESEDKEEDETGKIHLGSHSMYKMLLNNGADVNFPCFDTDNDTNQMLSSLGFCLMNKFDSVDHIGVIQDLLDHSAKLTHSETAVLSELFVKAAGKKMEEIDLYFGVLEDIAKNSGVALQNVTDLESNNPIHIAIIHHHAFNQNQDGTNTINDTRQTRILSQLCRRYPYWLNQRNVDNDYPLFVAAKYREASSVFALLSHLSGHDYDAMHRMIRERVFVESMILWAIDLVFLALDNSNADVQVLRIFLELFGYETIFCWPNPHDSKARQEPITLMDFIENKEEAQKQFMLDILMKQCNILQYVQNKDLIEVKAAIKIPTANLTDEYNFEEDIEDSLVPQQTEDEIQNKIAEYYISKLQETAQNVNIASSDDVKEAEEDQKEEKLQESEDEEDDDEEDDTQIIEDDDTEAVNWIELFYSMLVESFSTADLYTDIIILSDLYTAKQQWWVTFMVAFLAAPYLVSYSALGSIIQHRIHSFFLFNDKLNCCQWFSFNVIVLILMTPLCLMYFIVIDVIFMIYVLFSTVLFLCSCTKFDIRDFIDDVLFKNIFGMNRTQIIGYRRLRTLSQLFFESMPQIALQLRILWFIRQENKDNDADFGVNEGNIMWSIFFATLHLILEASIIYLDSRALRMKFMQYAIVCLGARVGWIPFNHLIEKEIQDTDGKHTEYEDDIDSDQIVIYDYDKIEARLLSTKIKYRLEYNFSNESLSNFGQTLGAIAPPSLPPSFYLSKLCNPMIESLLKNAMLKMKIKFGAHACRDIDVFTLAEFYQSTINKVHIDISDVDGQRIIRNNKKRTSRKMMVDTLMKYGLVQCADWLTEFDFDVKLQIKQKIIRNSLRKRFDSKYSRFDILRICYQHHRNSFYIALDCRVIKIIYRYLNKYFKMAKEDSSYIYVAAFLLYYTRGTILNHSCALGCCNPNQLQSQYIDLEQIRNILPTTILIEGSYEISFQLFQSFDLLAIYLEEFLLNLCRKRIVSTHRIDDNSTTGTIKLKPNQESNHIYQIMEEAPSSYCKKLHDIITGQAAAQKEDISTLDTLVTGFRMTELYNVYLYESLQFRSRPQMKTNYINRSITLTEENKYEMIQISFAEMNVFNTGRKNRQIDEIKIEFDNISASCHCRVYFNYNNMQLNNMLFFDHKINADRKEIVINLQQPKNGCALAYYNRHILDYNISHINDTDATLCPILIEFSAKITTDASITIDLGSVSYSVFNIQLNKELFAVDEDDISKDIESVRESDEAKDGLKELSTGSVTVEIEMESVDTSDNDDDEKDPDGIKPKKKQMTFTHKELVQLNVILTVDQETLIETKAEIDQVLYYLSQIALDEFKIDIRYSDGPAKIFPESFKISRAKLLEMKKANESQYNLKLVTVDISALIDLLNKTFGKNMEREKEEQALHQRELEEEQQKEHEANKLKVGQIMSFMKDVPSGTKFAHKHPLDENGILFYFGTKGTKKISRYINPADLGMVHVSASEMMDDSQPKASFIGRECVRCVTTPGAKCWFNVDFVNKYITPSHYTLRHYISWDTECLRNWWIEGSIDGKRWLVLRQHQNDQALNYKGQAYTWALHDYGCALRMFRIQQTGPNNNNHYFLACSGFEIYGTLYKEADDDDQTINDQFTKSYTEQQKMKQLSLVRFWQMLSAGQKGVYHFNCTDDEAQDGILHFLGTKGKQNEWINPSQSGHVAVASSTLSADSVDISYFVGKTSERLVSGAEDNAWMHVDFMDKLIQPTYYTLRHYSSWDTECLRNWVLQASNDGIHWVTVKKHEEDTSLTQAGALYTWPVQSRGAYRIWRIKQTGLNSNKHKYLACSGIEFYGQLFLTKFDSLEHVSNRAKAEKTLKSLQFLGTRQFQENNDKNGVIYYIGTKGGTSNWVNPSAHNWVKTDASSLMRDSQPTHALCGRISVRCATQPLENSWMSVDLQNFYIIPSHYSLRHYISWDTEALRNWMLEASFDGSGWTVLRTHANDTSLDKKGKVATWQLMAKGAKYRCFRITQMGVNSNKHYYLACSGFEIYGDIYHIDEQMPWMKDDVVVVDADEKETKEEKDQATALLREEARKEKQRLIDHLSARNKYPFYYSSDFDEKGILYFLGTDWRTAPWRNPAEMGVVAVTSSVLGKDSEPVSAICGRQTVRCCCAAEKNNWMMIDFRNLYVRITHYTLKHYSSWDTEVLRNWYLEGTNDLKKFKIIKEHKKDKSLFGKGSTHTFEVDPKGKRYRAFRIRQFGSNSNKHWYLACSGIEFYGEIYFKPR